MKIVKWFWWKFKQFKQLNQLNIEADECHESYNLLAWTSSGCITKDKWKENSRELRRIAESAAMIQLGCIMILSGGEIGIIRKF